MPTNVRLIDVFGAGATQDSSSLTFFCSTGLTAEGILAELLARLLRSQRFSLELEQGGVLQQENGQAIEGDLLSPQIEAEHYQTVLKPTSRISKLFLGLNSEDL